jgi:ABC-type phosphate transport system permease subunit
MSIFSAIGIILLASALVLFAYQGISAFLDMGTSDEFVYENVSFVDILDEEYFSWIDSISSTSIQSIAETLINAPVALWLLCGAVLCFLIHAFKGPKHIR